MKSKTEVRENSYSMIAKSIPECETVNKWQLAKIYSQLRICATYKRLSSYKGICQNIPHVLRMQFVDSHLHIHTHTYNII